MSEWRGQIVCRIYRVKGLKDEPVYLILVDDGDRIWRYESELKLEEETLGKKKYVVEAGK